MKLSELFTNIDEETNKVSFLRDMAKEKYQPEWARKLNKSMTETAKKHLEIKARLISLL